MDKIIGIYKITNPTGKIYIGQSANCKDRESRYKRGGCKSQARIYNSILKYGLKNEAITTPDNRI